MCMALVDEVTSVNLDDRAADVSRLGVPSDPIADLKSFSYFRSPNRRILARPFSSGPKEPISNA